MTTKTSFSLILLFSAFLIQCDMADKTTFDWQGHRGCRGLLPENTIPAFLKALEYPIKTLELDVVVSKDNKIIVSHDPYFSHHICKKPDGTPITEAEEKSFRIFEMNYEMIKTFDCGSRGNERFPEQQSMYVSKPSLEDMVHSVEAYCHHNQRAKPYYDIEIKSRPGWYGSMVPLPSDFVKLLLDELSDLGIKKRTCIQSFDPAVMIELHKQNSKITNSFLVENLESFETNLAKLDFTPDIYSPYYKFIDQELVSKVHEKGMRLIPWTINEVEEMKKLIDLGVDGIITDYPNRIEEALAEKVIKE